MNRKTKKVRRGGLNPLRKIILITAIIALILSLWMVVGQDLFDALRAHVIEDRTKDLYYSGSTSALPFLPVALAEEEEAREIKLPDVQDDFAALLDANADTIGWLHAGERIDYPVVLKDNWYYLSRNFYGQSDTNGTLFLNSYCTLFPRTDVLMIHGHNTRNGSMFARLTKFEDIAYVCKYPIVSFRTIYDESDVYYAPLFAFHASMEEDNPDYFDIARVSFENDPVSDNDGDTVRHSAEYQEYLDALAGQSLWQSPLDVTVDDQLLILVTCSYHQDNGRFVLVCRQLREGETPESVQEIFAQTHE